MSLVQLTGLLLIAHWCFGELRARALTAHPFEDRLVALETRTEKHPGRDDRHDAVLAGGGTREIDEGLAEQLVGHEGATLSVSAAKGAVLRMNGQPVIYDTRGDEERLAFALGGGILAPMIVLRVAAIARRRSRQRTTTV